MFTLTKRFTFEAAHQLPHHDGKCKRLHGHSFVMEVEVVGSVLCQEGPRSGMVMDYGDISSAVKPLIEQKLDHYFLNETTGLENPTSEELARWVYNHLKEALPNIYAVTIHETCTASCRYNPFMQFF